MMGLLLGDAGYALRRYLLVPLATPVTSSEKLYNSSHIETRAGIRVVVFIKVIKIN